MFENFKTRTRRHIDLVAHYLNLLSDYPGIDPDEARSRGKSHDRDKYADPSLIIPYIWVTEYHRANNEGPVST